MSDPDTAGARIEWPQPTPIREVWPGEASQFTPWLAEESNLDELGEALGLGALTLAGTEVSVPGTYRSLDILAETRDGARIAIENQYGEADHDHFTRGLAYAVGLNAAALVVIAENHRPEFVAVADHYNGLAERAGGEGAFPIFLVNISAKTVAGVHFPALDIVARPNEWLIAAEKTAKSLESSREETLAKFPADLGDACGRLAKAWEKGEGRSVRWGKQSVSLFVQPAGSAKAGCFQVSETGRMIAQLSALAEVSPLDESELIDLVESAFPDSFERQISGWLAFGKPSPDRMLAFLSEVCPELDLGEQT